MPIHLKYWGNNMLIISRKINETIRITEDIVIKVVKVNGGQVKIGIQAPSHVRVERHDRDKNKQSK